MPNITRRNFLRTTSAGVLTGVPLISGTKSAPRIIGANDTLRIAVADLNGRGKSHIGGFLGRKMLRLPM